MPGENAHHRYPGTQNPVSGHSIYDLDHSAEAERDKARLGVETSQLFQGNGMPGWDRACDAALQRRTAPPWWWEMPAHGVTLTINMLDLTGLCTSKQTAGDCNTLGHLSVCIKVCPRLDMVQNF